MLEGGGEDCKHDRKAGRKRHLLVGWLSVHPDMLFGAELRISSTNSLVLDYREEG